MMSENPELEGGTVDFAFDDGAAYMEQTMIDTFVEASDYEPLKTKVKVIESPDIEDTDYVLRLVGANSSVSMTLHIGDEKDAREFVDWLDDEVSKYE